MLKRLISHQMETSIHSNMIWKEDHWDLFTQILIETRLERLKNRKILIVPRFWKNFKIEFVKNFLLVMPNRSAFFMK